MEIEKFKDDTNFKQIYTRRDLLKQRIIDIGAKYGYKLYYYQKPIKIDDGFKLIEITKIGQRLDNWEDKWGEYVFFLNADEYNVANKIIGGSKKKYDAHIEAMKLLSELPLSQIYEICDKKVA